MLGELGEYLQAGFYTRVLLFVFGFFFTSITSFDFSFPVMKIQKVERMWRSLRVSAIIFKRLHYDIVCVHGP